ncbi:MAG: hypothetical protein K6E47_07270 [Lachnospiraceae bacterium]|nr:hypothetical protein [Lachnospiraceae bacterium]
MKKNIRSIFGALIFTLLFTICYINVEAKADEEPALVPVGTSIEEQEDEAIHESTFFIANTDSSLYSLESTGGNEYGYASLSAVQKKLFNSIGEKCEEFMASELYKTDLTAENSEITITYNYADGESFTKETLLETATRFYYSNPKYYWISSGYSYKVREDSCSVILSVASDFYTYASRKKADEAIAENLQSWVDEINAVKNEKDVFYAALKAHDIIIGNIDYAYDASGQPENSMWAHSIAGVFTGDGVVCEGYAKTFEYLLNLARIPNIYIVGKGKNEAHAWNAVKYRDAWYLCDVTWDDPNEKDPLGFNNTKYTYFFMPSSLFSKDHTPDTSGREEMYDLPAFADKIEDSFFGKFKCYTADGIDEESGAAFAAEILANRYPECDYVYAAFPKGQEGNFIQYVAPHITGEKITGTYSYSVTPYGYVMRFLAPVISNPAKEISFEKTELSLDVDAETELTAIIAEDSDDRILWEISTFDPEDRYTAKRYVKLKTDGRSALLKGLKDGKVILKAIVYSSTLKGAEKVLSAECVITVGTGESSADAVIWQNGIKEKKTYTITTSLKATTWTDSKKKTKNGKLVWFVSDTALVPKFDPAKHTVSFGVEKSKSASVNGKGVVTAKKAGKVFVYVCDTGSMTYEEYGVDILAAPSKLTLVQKAGSQSKDDAVKKLGADVGDTVKVYISPFVKDGKADEDCTYTVKTAKTEQGKYLSITEAQQDDDGNPFFTFTAKDYDREKSKTVSVKLDIVCNESNKKASLTVVIGNSATGASLTGTSDKYELKMKKDTVSLNLVPETHIENIAFTTDKIKIYVGKTSVTLSSDGKKVSVDGGATVKAKYDAKTGKLNLTAGQDAGAPAVIVAAFTNSYTKKVTLVELARIDAAGIVTLAE